MSIKLTAFTFLGPFPGIKFRMGQPGSLIVKSKL